MIVVPMTGVLEPSRGAARLNRATRLGSALSNGRKVAVADCLVVACQKAQANWNCDGAEPSGVRILVRDASRDPCAVRMGSDPTLSRNISRRMR